jgi:hypothetical protein
MSTADMVARIAANLVANRAAVKSTSEATAKRKSVKAQRNAESALARKAALESAFIKEELLPWTPPMSFKDWAKDNGLGSFKTPKAAIEAGFPVLVDQYKEYKDEVFNAPITSLGAFERILRKQIARERWDSKANLGLLGYSADDLVQLAVIAAWANLVATALIELGYGADHSVTQPKLTKDGTPVLNEDGTQKMTRKVCLCMACEVRRALTDRRSDKDLALDAHGHGQKRYVYVPSTGRFRTQEPLAATKKAQRLIEARAFYKAHADQLNAATLVPSVGAVYREVAKVRAEGLRQFSNTLEGLTPDGTMDTIERDIASNRTDLLDLGMDKLVTKLDRSLSRHDAYFGWSSYDTEAIEREYEVINREAGLKVLKLRKERQDLLPAEADALTFIEELRNGQELWDIMAAFKLVAELQGTSVPQLSTLAKDSKLIMSEAQASDDFLIARRVVVEQFYGADTLAYIAG